MQWEKMIQIMDVHCEGEVGSVVTGGLLDIPGSTMNEKLAFFSDTPEGQKLLRFLCNEPRGPVAGSVNILTPATRPDADAGFLVLQPSGVYAMSGSNAICVTTALLESGMVPMREPESVVMLDTAAGLVKALAHCENGKCKSVTLDMMPSFVDALDVEFTYNTFNFKADIAFGGVYYAIVDVDQIGLTIDVCNNNDLYRIGIEMCEQINQLYSVQHPMYPDQNSIAYVMFRQFDGEVIRTCTTLKPGRCDRSPCGTGSSANLAVMYAKGLAQQGQEFTTQSIIGSQFKVMLAGITEVAGKVAVLPRITGGAWSYGFHQVALDPSDPFPEGFVLSAI